MKQSKNVFFAGSRDYSPDEVIDQVNTALKIYGLRCEPLDTDGTNDEDNDVPDDEGYGYYEIVKIR